MVWSERILWGSRGLEQSRIPAYSLGLRREIQRPFPSCEFRLLWPEQDRHDLLYPLR